jgi:6-phosphogluconate dehydrogenase (decarboxylating)
MQFGMIGLGRMGGNMVRRLMRDGHACVVQDVSPDVVAGRRCGSTWTRGDGRACLSTCEQESA